MTIKKILIGYDGSACADEALLDLKKAGMPSRASVLVVSIAEVFLPPPDTKPLPGPVLEEVKKSWQHAERAVKDAQRMADYAARKIKKAFPSWKIKSEGIADSPSWGIVTRAKAWKADLIVLGARGVSAPGRLLLGSTSQLVATQAHCSVRIVHGKSEELNSPVRIVVGVDGSEGAYKAIDAVAARSWKKGSAVHFVTVIDSRLKTAAIVKLRTMHQKIEQAKKKLQAKGCVASSLNQEGDPKKVLLDEAKRWGADAVFTGSRGLTGIKYMLLGSVSASLAARAECPVEIVR